MRVRASGQAQAAAGKGFARGSQLGLYAHNYALVPDPLVTLLGDLAPAGADWGVMN